MSGTHVEFEFDEHTGLYKPGETISGQYRVIASDPASVKAIELSILWVTSGKGEEDLTVHHFQREASDAWPLNLTEPRRFNTELPYGPLSYQGAIFRICWLVRARVLMRRGKELVEDQPFQLGSVPAVPLPPEPVLADMEGPNGR